MIIKIKYMLLIALAALVSCSSDEFVGDTGSPNGEAGSGNAAISFGFDVPQVTRASGAEAATKLSNQFIVYGEKSESDDGAAPAAGKLVFQNYKVAYTSNTAYTTQSNTKDWEYVGQQWTNDESSNIITSTADLQTIKYWDYSASNYVFTAVSALPADISSGRVKITKTTSATSGNKVYDKGYTITLAKTTGSPAVYPTLSDIYISDRLVINQGSGSDRNAENAYGGNVTLTFRNLLSQVRAGVYETIPGYDIISMDFYVSDGNDADSDLDKLAGHAFGAICPNVKIGGGFEGTLNVTYYGAGTAAENQPKVSVSGSSGSAADLILGTNMSTLNQTSPTLLGTTAVAPTWDTANGDYTNVLPQSVDNTTNLKLKCDYTLWNSVTGETIEVKGATAEIPSRYLQWKSNFKYTYLFKISDNTNGSTGQDVTGLYPITFDAVEMVNGDGIAEYITTVSEPSITTFGVKNNKYIAEHGTVEAPYDYPASTAVYAVVEDGSSLATLNGGNMMLYTVTTENATSFPITAASVAEALIEAPTMNATQAAAAKIKFPTNPALTYQNTVPGEDGITITLDASLNKAATFTTATTATVYALVYQKTAATYNWDSGQEYTNSDSDHDLDDFTAAGALYTRTGAGTEESPYGYTLATSYVSGTTYYKPTAVSNKGEYVVKIVTCPNE